MAFTLGKKLFFVDNFFIREVLWYIGNEFEFEITFEVLEFIFKDRAKKKKKWGWYSFRAKALDDVLIHSNYYLVIWTGG